MSRIVVLLLVQAAAVAFAARAPGNGTGRIALAPIGEVRTEEISTLRQPLKAAFGVEVVLAPRLPLPSSAYDRERGQYRSTILLDALARARQPEWERLVGVTQVDLYVPELNFVFGEGDSRGGSPCSPSRACARPTKLSGNAAPRPRRSTSSGIHMAFPTAMILTA